MLYRHKKPTQLNRTIFSTHTTSHDDDDDDNNNNNNNNNNKIIIPCNFNIL